MQWNNYAFSLSWVLWVHKLFPPQFKHLNKVWCDRQLTWKTCFSGETGQIEGKIASVSSIVNYYYRIFGKPISVGSSIFACVCPFAYKPGKADSSAQPIGVPQYPCGNDMTEGLQHVLQLLLIHGQWQVGDVKVGGVLLLLLFGDTVAQDGKS